MASSEMSVLTLDDGCPFDPSIYRVRLRTLSEDEGGGWFSTIPDRPGCMGEGESEMEAIADVRLAAVCWVEGALKDGEAIPAPSHETLEAAE